MISSAYVKIRNFTEELVKPLETEDYVIQSIEDVSPPKWHLAHTTWFFETFVLKPHMKNYNEFHPKFLYLFNSYYETVGPYFPRPSRGNLSRPTVYDVYKYREYVDSHMLDLMCAADEGLWKAIKPIVELGLHHEQQHQELLLTDIKYNFSINPLEPVYSSKKVPQLIPEIPFTWHAYEGGLVDIGHEGNEFTFDNEGPRHKQWLQPYQIASRPVTNGEFKEFIDDQGYHKAQYWLSDGWNEIRKAGWAAPLYWEKIGDEWYYFTLSGFREIDWNEPVCHVSFYEADAFARWAGKRLPTEEEWEHTFSHVKKEGNFVESGYFHPVSSASCQGDSPSKGFGDVWEWTQSPYIPYPGNKPLEGGLGEYNAKFMCNQMVLRGGSCATSSTHIRLTYRNFFQPEKRWQFSGFRLAEDLL